MAHHSPIKVVFLDRETIPDHITLPTLRYPHHWQSYPATAPDDVIERLQQADVAVINKVVINDTILAALPKLKLIAVAATGVNNVDLDACRANRVQVCNVQGYATQSVPEHVMALIFCLETSIGGLSHRCASRRVAKTWPVLLFHSSYWQYRRQHSRDCWKGRIRESGRAIGPGRWHDGDVCRSPRGEGLSAWLSAL